MSLKYLGRERLGVSHCDSYLPMSDMYVRWRSTRVAVTILHKEEGCLEPVKREREIHDHSQAASHASPRRMTAMMKNGHVAYLGKLVPSTLAKIRNTAKISAHLNERPCQSTSRSLAGLFAS